MAGALLPANLERAVHPAGAVIVAGVAVAAAGVVVARVENQAVVRFGTAVGESPAGGDQLQAQVARVENQAVAAVDGAPLENPERVRDRNQKDRKQNLPRARVDIGVGAIVPRMDGNLVVAAGPPPPESQVNLALHHLEVDGMERMTTIGQEVILPITSPANLKTMTGLEAGKEDIPPLASPNLSLLRPIPLAGKMMDGMPTSTTRLTFQVFAKSVTQ